LAGWKISYKLQEKNDTLNHTPTTTTSNTESDANPVDAPPVFQWNHYEICHYMSTGMTFDER
jgi:hypothetical protein